MVLKHCIIYIFLIHSDSVQKILSTLFKLVWNTQKGKWNFFLVTRQDVTMLLNIE